MSSAGRSGTSDTGMGNSLGAQSGSDLNGVPLGTGITGTGPAAGDLQPDAVEVVEVVTLEGTPSPADADLYGAQTPSPFRWWYVPAVAVPVVAGGALVWYLRKGQQPFKDFSNLLGRQGNNVSDWMQDRFQTTRRPTPSVSRKTAALAGAVATAPLWDRAGGWLSDWSDDLGDLIDRDRIRATVASAREAARGNLTRATKTTKAKTTAAATSNRWDDFRDLLADTGNTVGDTVADWWAGMGGATVPAAADKARANAKSAATKSALAAATVKAAKPAASTAKVAKKTRKSANSAFRRTRTFTFAMLVTAMYTYMRMWRQRLNERTMRETASGRREPDREPMFSR